MANVKLEWEQNSIADSFNIYRSVTPMNPENLPIPIGTTTSLEYTDYDVVVDTTYYYRVASIRGGLLKVSSEINIFTSDDPDAGYLTNHLTFADSNLFDIKQAALWQGANGSPGYVTSGGKIALNMVKPFNIISPNNLSVSDKFTLILDITFLADPSYSQQAIASFSSNDPNSSISIFRFNGTGFAFYIGTSGAVEVNANLVDNARMTVKIIKSPTNVSLFINDTLRGVLNIAGNIPANSKLYIGRNPIDTTRGLNAIVHEIKYYHNFEKI